MKKNFTLLTFLCFSIICKAQFINGFTLIPANPSASDNIKLIANMSFPSGPCNDHQQFISFNGNVISASAIHCLGMLTVICNYSDTFSLGQLPVGNYRFDFNVNAGSGPSPCSPGIVPGPSDSLNFTVTQPSSLPEVNPEVIRIQYHPLSKKINIQFAHAVNSGNVRLYNATGQVLRSLNIKGSQQSISTVELPKGLYIVEITSEQGRLTRRILVQD